MSDHIAGYVARKLSPYSTGCCEELLFDSISEGNSYHQLVSRGGLKIASPQLNFYVAKCFALLDACSPSIRMSPLDSRMAGENVLQMISKDENFCCPKHDPVISRHAIRIITNVFFNNQRKRTTETVVDDRVAAFKKTKRTK